MALRDIENGEELFFDYDLDSKENQLATPEWFKHIDASFFETMANKLV